jgi:hypothetical protein
LGVAGLAYVLIRFGSFDWDLGTLGFLALILALGALPYALVALFARWNRDSGLAQGAGVVTLGVILTFGAREMHNAFLANPDPQSGLILLFLPVAQVVMTVPLFLVRPLARVIGRRG